MNNQQQHIATAAPVTSARGTALVIGATGGIGGAVAQALLARGYRVRALSRRPERPRAPSPSSERWSG